MRLPFKGRFCSLAAASLLTSACGGQATHEHASDGDGRGGGQAGGAGGIAATGGQAGASAGTGGAGAGSGASAGTGGTVAGGGASSAGSTGGDACAEACRSVSCGECEPATAAADTCVISPPTSRVVGVMFDCVSLEHGPDGYDFDAQGQLLLTGEPCSALNTAAPHRIEIVLGCPLDK